MQRDLTQGPIRRGLILFSLPLIAGNLLQQLYNIVDPYASLWKNNNNTPGNYSF